MLETLNIRPDEIADERLAEAFRVLLQLIEQLYEDIEKLKVEVQRLRDENNLLINPFRVLEETRRVFGDVGRAHKRASQTRH